MTALRYHQGNVLHDQVVGSATEHMHILRRPKIGYVQIGTCCCKGFDIDGSYRVEDALKQIALALRARAASHEYARTLRLWGPWRLPRLCLQRLGPTWHIEQWPDIAEIVGQRVSLKVERLTGREQKPVGLIEQIHDIREHGKAELGTGAVENGKRRIHRRCQPGTRCIDFGALLRCSRLAQSAGGRRHSRQGPNTDMRGKKGEGHIRCLRPQRSTKQEVEAENSVRRHAANLVP